MFAGGFLRLVRGVRQEAFRKHVDVFHGKLIYSCEKSLFRLLPVYAVACNNRTDEIEHCVVNAVAGLGEEVIVLHRLPADGAMRPRPRVGADTWQALQKSRLHTVEICLVVLLLETLRTGVILLKQFHGIGPVAVHDANVKQAAFEDDAHIAAKPLNLIDTSKARIAAREVFHEALQHIIQLVRTAFVIEEPVITGQSLGAEVLLENGVLAVIFVPKHICVVVVDVEQALIRTIHTSITFSHFFISPYCQKTVDSQMSSSPTSNPK